MAQGYLLDSNVIIGFLASRIPASGIEIISTIIDQIPRISVITQIEVLRFNDTPENEKVLSNFIDSSIIHPLSSDIVNRTILLCKQKKIKLPDAIIAATALNENLILVTRNTSDFTNIPDLELFNPWEI
ncbi:MAG: type II toxin-antitoxin system VapC family toxin [Treponema sp.]|nr:type II toxin-antitoxin system VapC family toxin [Treponema sp.]